MTHHSLRHYKEKHYSAIDTAKTYEELCAIALDVLKNMPQPIVVVCGPLSTGGTGDIKKNLALIEQTIYKLSDRGQQVFNYLPFEKAIPTLKAKFGENTREKNQLLLDNFYLAIYSSGFIKKMYFLDGWELSHGASWEREIAKKHSIEIEDLPKDFLEQ